tara:strand:+ start:7594 stop:8958 length:1365 start_codon:yes stop_codon:yes gene_type:complete
MKKIERTVLLIDDDLSSLETMEAICEELGLRFKSYQDPTKALEALRVEPDRFSTIICDLVMPKLSGYEFIQEAHSFGSEIPIIIITGNESIETAINCLEAGAYDYVTKPINIKELSILISRAIKIYQTKIEYEKLKMKFSEIDSSYFNFIGKNKKILEIFNIVKKVGSTDAGVLILGETGTGKELIAKAIHNSSKRKNEKMVTINCASIPEHLLESELFGHKKGAFTGADSDRDGLFTEASKGTIFLDEIGEMPIGLQSKLLRVLQENKIRRVGDNNEIAIDVRVIAATHQDLPDLIRQGNFREDLFYRLNVLSLTIPPLRDRLEDLPLLANYFFKKFSKSYNSKAKRISNSAIQKLYEYHWPGNVRELENTIERACIMSSQVEISPEEIVFSNSNSQQQGVASSFSDLPSLKELERDYISYLIQHCDGVKERVAEILKINRKTLYRKIKDLEL